MVHTRSESTRDQKTEESMPQATPADSGVATGSRIVLGPPASPTDPLNESRTNTVVARDNLQSARSTTTERSNASSAHRRRAARLAMEEKLAAIEREKIERIFALEKRLAEKRLQNELERIAIEEENEQDDQLEPQAAPAPEPSTEVALQRTQDWVEATALHDAAAAPPPPPPPRSSGETDIDKLAQAIGALANNKQRCCTSSLPEFSGRVEDWLSFKAAYEEQSRRFDSLENLARLRRALKGEAKAVVSSYLITGGDPAKVIELLARKFGRPTDQAKHLLSTLRKLPTIVDIPRQLNDFAITVETAVTTLRSTKQEGYLHSIDLIETVKSKIDVLMRDYCRYAVRRAADSTPELVKLSEFLTEEAEAVSQAWPVDSRAPPTARPAYAATPPPRHRAPAGKGELHGRSKQAVHTSTEAATTRIKCGFCDAADHGINTCAKFAANTQEERWDWVCKSRLCFRCLRPGHRAPVCRSKSRCTAPGCNSQHHTLLHRSRPTTPQQTSEATGEISASTNGTTDRALVKIVPVTIYGPRGSTSTYALLDDGATITLLSAAVADRVGATGPQETLELKETTSSRAHPSQRVSVDIAGPSNERYTLKNARTVPRLGLTTQSVGTYRDMKHLEDLPLTTYRDATPEVLIGNDHFHLLAAAETRSGEWHEPSAVRTRLGWVLVGPTGRNRRRTSHAAHFVGHSADGDEELTTMLKASYDLDALGVSSSTKENPEDARALRTLQETCRKMDDGDRWEAGLLWREEEPKMPPSRESAIKRLNTLEKKMDRDRDFGEAYARQIEHLIEAGYARRAEPTESKKKWYLPHFAVTNPNKPGKLRVVFDAAARVHGRSLNDALLTGPDLLQSLLGVIFRFREGRYAVSADIREMFLRVGIRKEDRAAQRFLWRGWERTSPPTEYEMTSMIFGAASSPTTAIYVKNRTAEEYASEYPNAARAMVANFYMDDYLQSFADEETAARVSAEVKKICARGGFELTSWATNHPSILGGEGADGHEHRALGPHDVTQQKTLGLRWSPTEDTLGFNLNLARVSQEIADGASRPTKREMLRLVMSVFDPLGLLAPITIQAKTLLQRVHRSGIEWDAPLRDAEAADWTEWLQRLKRSWTTRVPRNYFRNAPEDGVELHTFCDASERAYAAVCYFRAVREGKAEVALVASKSRVASLKATSIPRLELQAALLGSRLAATVEHEHSWKIKRRVFWTDSRTALHWIRSDPRNYKPFVAHRLGEIEELTNPGDWRWVPTKENVADDATRALEALSSEHRWFHGPAFLREPEEKWPPQPEIKATNEEARQPELAAATASREPAPHVPSPTRFSSWHRLLRATATVVAFAEKCRRRQAERMTRGNLDRAEELLLRASQEEAFSAEKKCLISGQPLPRESRLQHLSPYLDDSGLIRLRGRANAAPGIEPTAREPVILCGHHPTTRLLVHHHHVAAHHAGREMVVNELRQRYWVVNLRPTVRAVEHACQICRIRKATAQNPPMGDLPKARLDHHQRAFTSCGLDYFGPIDVAVGRRREKRYGALFTCLVTRAVHIEVAHSLTTDSAIAALRRMIARRGTPSVIITDNGTNFRGAATELQRAWSELDQDAIKTFALMKGADWRFIPPGAPFMGGAWERLVGSVKRALSATLHERAPTDEVLMTLLAEAEHTLNARPLTHVSVDPKDPEALTPMHFLLGTSSGATTPGNFDDADLARRRQWRATQRLADVFWQRWMREYLPTLLPRRLPGDNRPELKPGDFVVIADESLPRNVWPRGIVERALPGRDGHVRVVDVRTTGGTLRRPAKRIVRLPVEGQLDESRR